MAAQKPDFSAWATKNDLLCSDGRVIRQNSFAHQDGTTVPLIYAHEHKNINSVLGRFVLENKPEGVYGYGYFNDTEQAKHAKTALEHGDINMVSIHATGLKQRKNEVLHGDIKEVSLVLAGANPGATIDCPVIETPILAHGLDAEDEMIFFSGEMLEHKEPENLSHEGLDKNVTLEDALASMNPNQQTAMLAILSGVLSELDSEIEHGGIDVKKNAFDKTQTPQAPTLSEGKAFELIHSAIEQKITLKEATENWLVEYADTLSHDDTTGADYGITDIEILFPDAQNLTNEPQTIDRDQEWVGRFMNGTHHSPFARIRTIFADITADEARAKGYVKGNKKIEEVIRVLKRETNPTTVYKKQKLDRDDVIDIVSFDVVRWLRSEMRGKWDEEVARAALIGDGRGVDNPDKIDEEKIRPIMTDDDLFTIKHTVTYASGASDNDRAKAFIKAAIKARKNYKGSGNPTLWTTEDLLTEMLLIEDVNGRDIYDSVTKLASKMRVRDIVTVPVMEGATREDSDGNTTNVLGIIVNPADYNFGADKGGQVSMFDDFDIDFNQYKYLLEARCSGALTKPYSAIVLETARV